MCLPKAVNSAFRTNNLTTLTSSLLLRKEKNVRVESEDVEKDTMTILSRGKWGLFCRLGCAKSVIETGHLLERQGNKTAEFRAKTEQLTIDNIQRERRLRWLGQWTRDANGSPAHTTASVVLGGTGMQERSRSTTNELEEHSQQRPRQKMRLSWEEAEVAALDRHG